MRITIDGQNIRAVNLNTARGRDILALQQQTGYGLDELNAMAQDKTKQVILTKVLEFLSEHNRGRFLTWDEVLDKPMPTIELEPGDMPQRDGELDDAGEAAGPTPASTASQPVDAAAVAKPKGKGKTHGSKRSTAKNGGSTSRSTAASSTS